MACQRSANRVEPPQLPTSFFELRRDLRPSLFTDDLRKKKNSNFDAGTTAILNMASLTIHRKTLALTIRRKKPTRDDVRECDGRAYVRGSSEIANLHTQRGKRRERHPADAEVLHLRSEAVRLSDRTQMPSYLGLRIQTKDKTRVI